MLPKQVFLSHSAKDKQFVSSLAAVLRRHKVPYWYSTSSLEGAQQWHDEIGKALKNCNWFVLILTPNSVKSEWVKHELMYALSNKRYKGRIVPLLLKPCNFAKLSWTLSDFQRIDFTKKKAEGYTELLKIWGIPYTPK
ncbi:MAG TPA: toll/interleukin-1 receptor domain-containing protein [Pyrinomonadaceae bacterium]|jgi:hypothetical protein